MVKKCVKETIVFEEEDVKKVVKILDALHNFRNELEKIMETKYPIDDDEIVYLLNDINDHNVDEIKDFFDTYGYDVEMPSLLFL